jgi:hypothetical protein
MPSPEPSLVRSDRGSTESKELVKRNQLSNQVGEEPGLDADAVLAAPSARHDVEKLDELSVEDEASTDLEFEIPAFRDRRPELPQDVVSCGLFKFVEEVICNGGPGIDGRTVDGTRRIDRSPYSSALAVPPVPCGPVGRGISGPGPYSPSG